MQVVFLVAAASLAVRSQCICARLREQPSLGTFRHYGQPGAFVFDDRSADPQVPVATSALLPPPPEALPGGPMGAVGAVRAEQNFDVLSLPESPFRLRE